MRYYTPKLITNKLKQKQINDVTAVQFKVAPELNGIPLADIVKQEQPGITFIECSIPDQTVTPQGTTIRLSKSVGSMSLNSTNTGVIVKKAGNYTIALNCILQNTREVIFSVNRLNQPMNLSDRILNVIRTDNGVLSSQRQSYCTLANLIEDDVVSFYLVTTQNANINNAYSRGVSITYDG